MPRKIFQEKFIKNLNDTLKELLWVIDGLILLEMPDSDGPEANYYINLVATVKSKQTLTKNKCLEMCPYSSSFKKFLDLIETKEKDSRPMLHAMKIND